MPLFSCPCFWSTSIQLVWQLTTADQKSNQTKIIFVYCWVKSYCRYDRYKILLRIRQRNSATVLELAS
jgi:hypothetical protein